MILFVLARRTARQIEKVSLFYGERRFPRLVDHATQRRVSDVEGSPPNLLLRVLRLLRQAVAGVSAALRFQSDEEVHGVLSNVELSLIRASAVVIDTVIDRPSSAEPALRLASFHKSRWVIWDVVVSVDCIHQTVAALRSFIPRRVGATTIIVGAIGPAEALDLADCRRAVSEAGSVVRDLDTAPSV